MTTTLTGQVLDDTIELTLIEITEACSLSTEQIVEFVEEGVLEPIGEEQSNWRFRGTCLNKARVAVRLQKDLGLNLAGVALALDLLSEIETLRLRLRLFETSTANF
jgi:chaperone modulatory protein CbpM